MPDFLGHWISGTQVDTHKNWVAKALTSAFPDGRISEVFTHARSVLAPSYPQLLDRARRCEGKTLDTRGIKRREPLLALAVEVADHGFGKADGAETRQLLFQAVVEVVAADEAHAKSADLIKVCHALRVELEELRENVHARSANPDFASIWEAMVWFGQETERYPDDATAAWRNRVSTMLRRALLEPLPPPDIPPIEDDDGDITLVTDVAPSLYDSESDDDEPGLGIPPSYWLVPEETIRRAATLDEAAQEEFLKASLSTYIPLGRFTPASPTYLSEHQASGEASRLISEAIEGRESEDRWRQQRALLRALSLATGTPISHLPRLRWGQPSKATTPVFPGLLSPCGRWLFRPELKLRTDSLTRDGWIPIPIPKVLAQELLAGARTTEEGALVFPLITGSTSAPDDRSHRSRHPTHTQLHRALICRLMLNKRWGPSAAQYVAGNDLGIDVAPLHYDRIPVSELAFHVREVTFPWFDEANGKISKIPGSKFVGSRRVPETATIKKALGTLYGGMDRDQSCLAETISLRAKNLVHGLLLSTGHRPNQNIGSITRRHINPEDGIAILSDKAAGPDWAHRPVALARRWIKEYHALLGDLESATALFGASALGEAARAALDGHGPVLLIANSVDDVAPFSISDYFSDLPSSLAGVTNFARQFLNDQLSSVLPESLRIAQLGWHGTRAGAFSDGSPLSVRKACAQISPKIDDILKLAGWRPLEGVKPKKPRSMAAISWVDAEREHERDFRTSLRRQKSCASERRSEVRSAIAPRLSELLSFGTPQLRIGLVFDGQRLQKRDSASAPVVVPNNWSEEIIWLLSAGDCRSLQAHAARSWMHELIQDAKKRNVLLGSTPRRSVERWPDQAGPFLRFSADAIAVARRLDALVSNSDCSRGLKTIATILLHGGYADLRAVVSAMSPGAVISGMSSMPSVLLVAPCRRAIDAEADPSALIPDWQHGTIAFHGLAAVALLSWHRSENEPIDLRELDRELGLLATGELLRSSTSTHPLSWLHELEALARTINSLRMDGVARLVGTGRTLLASAPIERVVARRDNLPMGPRSAATSREWGGGPPRRKVSATPRTNDLLDDLIAAIRSAVDHSQSDRTKEAVIRRDLEAQLRLWVGSEDQYSPEGLIALYALLLLVYGGRRRKHLALTTVQDYVYAVARPLVATLPASPMDADSEEWTETFMMALALVEKSQRPARASALENFHWLISQHMPVPSVDFGEVFAFAGRATYLADAGFLTEAELEGLSWALGNDIEFARSLGTGRSPVNEAVQRSWVAKIAFSGSLRPGEATRLTFKNLPFGPDDRLHVAKNRLQRLKNFNARRCPSVVSGQFGISTEDLLNLFESAKQRFSSEFRLSMPILQPVGDVEFQQLEEKVLRGLSQLIKWATGDIDASAYWLRKTAITAKLERVMASDDGSLWPIRHLLAEIGHAEISTTLASYTHDPVTPFLRWFKESWMTIDAERMASAARRSRNVVSRRRGGPRLAGSSATRVEARLADLLKSAPYLGTPKDEGAIFFPRNEGRASGDGAPPTAGDVSCALELITAFGPESAQVAVDWPRHSRAALLSAVAELEEVHSVLFTTNVAHHASDVVVISLPRRLQKDGGLWGLLGDSRALPTLSEIFEAWMNGLGFRIAETKIVASPADWTRWFEAVPVLSTLGWETLPASRRKQERILPGRDRWSPGLWPTLRWVSACAWIHRKIAHTGPDATP